MRRAVLLAWIFILSAAATGAARADEGPGRLSILGRSLLLPGLGHQAMGHSGRAQGFMAAEAAIWGAFGVFRVQGKIRKDSYIEMAEVFAGVQDANGRSDDYYRRVGRFRNSDLYNDEVRRDARARHRDDLEARASYFERHRVPADQVWNWSSEAARRRYRTKRNDSNEAYQRAGYMIGVALGNRLLAAVDAMRLAHGADRGTTTHLSLRPDPDIPAGIPQLCVTVRFP